MSVLGFSVQSVDFLQEDWRSFYTNISRKIQETSERIALINLHQESPFFALDLAKEERNLKSLKDVHVQIITYSDLGVIQRGAAGAVHKVKHPLEAKKEYALKLSHFPETKDPATRNELNKLVYLNEKEQEEGKTYVATLLAGFQLDGERLALVFPFYQSDLFDFLRRKGPSSPKDTLVFLQGMLETLSFLKRHEVIHLDIKPENIFIRSDGKYILGDFGLSLSKKTDSLRKNLGTPPYISPELAISADFCDFSSSDMWSTAVTVGFVFSHSCIFGESEGTGPSALRDSIRRIFHSQQKKFRSPYPLYLQEKAREKNKEFLLCSPESLHMSSSFEELMERHFSGASQEREFFVLLVGILKRMFDFNHLTRITPEEALVDVSDNFNQIEQRSSL